jgi:hypothetical protein
MAGLRQDGNTVSGNISNVGSAVAGNNFSVGGNLILSKSNIQTYVMC